MMRRLTKAATSSNGSDGIILSIHIDRCSTQSLRMQIYDRIKQMILTGQLSPGARLPSTRVMASEMRIARSTVANAFDQLQSEGYIESRVGSGSYITSVIPDLLLNANAELSLHPPASTRPSARGARIEQATADLSLWPATFTPGMPAVMDFPFRAWADLLAEEWQSPGLGAFFGDIGGYWPLRENIASYVAASRGIQCDADQVIVVSGTRQGADLSARTLLNPGDGVIVEDPGFPGIRSALIAAGQTLLPAAVDREGIRTPGEVPEAAWAKMVSLSPSHQYPLGVTMTLERRRAWLEWASKSDGWILEDDYDSEFRYNEPPLPALYGLDKNERVIYIGTFSKTMFPSLRLGYVIVPKHLIASFCHVKHASDGPTSLISQRAISRFMDDGLFFRHIRKMRKLYSERRHELTVYVKSHFPDLIIARQDAAGLFFLTFFNRVLPDAFDAKLVQHARVHGLYPEALSTLYMSENAPQGIVFGFGGSSKRLAGKSVALLSSLYHELLGWSDDLII